MEGIIKVVTQEYREGDLAVRTTTVTFLHIPIFKFRKTSTNNIAVNQLTVVRELINEVKEVKGFKYEN